MYALSRCITLGAVTSWRAMRPGLFFAFFTLLVPLAVVLALVVPVPGDFQRRAGGMKSEPVRTPVCYRLSYEPADAGRWLPRWVRLTDISARGYSRPGRLGFGVISGDHFQSGRWRVAGADSMDIQWYDSPILRLPTHGDTLVGRGGWDYFPSLFDELASHGFSVRAVRTECAARSREPACPRSWHDGRTADLSMVLCIPPGFKRSAGTEGVAWWARGRITSREHAWLRIDVEAPPFDADRWPPHLASGPECGADCATADSVVEHLDTLAGIAVHVETGLVSGGFPGFRRQPALAAGWIIPTGARVWVQGLAPHGATLDTLRTALRSLMLRVP